MVFTPSTVLIEFLTWFVWWTAFVTLQKRLCRRYPGLRSVCRMVYLGTLLVVIVPGVWVLARGIGHRQQLLAVFNHVFGISIYAQTALRSLLILRWMAWSGPHFAMAVATPVDMTTEKYLVASLVAMTHVLGRVKDKAADEA
ncbi:MAG TPA: hypothetical protein VLY04_16555 [Bryobacteraceae bacterium]|nr:hypothetical protein [Bryobacteraceae bacterium]